MRRHLADLMPGIFVGFVLAAFTVIVIMSVRPDPSPIEWLEYSGIDGEHCPGDVIPYRVVMRIGKAGPVFATSSIMRADNNAEVEAYRNDPWAVEWSERTGLPIAGDTVTGQRMSDIFVTVISQSDVLFVDKDFSFTVPDLPPGRYVRNVAAGMFSPRSEVTIRSQPFTVPDNCGE